MRRRLEPLGLLLALVLLLGPGGLGAQDRPRAGTASSSRRAASAASRW